MPTDGDLTLIAASRNLSGWTDVRVTRGIERVPSDFEIGLTERYPGEADDVTVKPGDPCQVMIGGDLVVTGYVDQLENNISGTQHRVVVRGRGKCEDLVDSAAEWPNGQIPTATVLQIAQKLAAPLNITVNALVDTGKPVPMFALIHGETVYEIIDRICRYRGLLAYEDETGALVFAHAGTTSAASGFVLGQNVIEATAHFRMDESFSDYYAYAQAIDIFADPGGLPDKPAHITDFSVPRHRVMAIVAESTTGGLDIANARAAWECNRRHARQMSVTIIADSWRDLAGALWRPNTLAGVSLPSLKIDKVQWLISEVTYKRGEDGTTCELMLAAPAAFVPQPVAPPDFTLVDVPGKVGF